MGIASKYNKVNVFDFKIPDDFTYKSLVELFTEGGAEKVHVVKALYINKKSRYGESPIVVTNECLANLPAHLTETVKEMMHDEEFVKAVNDGKVGMKIYSYETPSRTGLCYSVNWIDL